MKQIKFVLNEDIIGDLIKTLSPISYRKIYTIKKHIIASIILTLPFLIVIGITKVVNPHEVTLFGFLSSSLVGFFIAYKFYPSFQKKNINQELMKLFNRSLNTDQEIEFKGSSIIHKNNDKKIIIELTSITQIEEKNNLLLFYNNDSQMISYIPLNLLSEKNIKEIKQNFNSK